jgi:hypothetical protein
MPAALQQWLRLQQEPQKQPLVAVPQKQRVVAEVPRL